MDRAFFYAVMVGGVAALCILLLLNNVPIAVFTSTCIGFMAMLRGIVVWG